MVTPATDGPATRMYLLRKLARLRRLYVVGRLLCLLVMVATFASRPVVFASSVVLIHRAKQSYSYNATERIAMGREIQPAGRAR
jgi:hypothetical protein